MFTYAHIKKSLAEYDRKKSIWRRFMADKEIIKSLRPFARDNNTELSSTDLFKVINLIDMLRKNSDYGSIEKELADSLQSNTEIKFLVLAADQLKENNIFTKDNFEAVLATKTRASKINKYFLISSALVKLNEAGILTSENRTALVNNSDLDNIRSAFNLIYIPDIDLPPHFLLLTQGNFDSIIDHNDPHDLTLELRELSRAGILNDQTRNAVKNHASAYEMRRALICLHDPFGHNIISKKDYTTENIFTPDNIDAVSNHADPLYAVYALCYLYSEEILTSENRDLVKNHPKPKSLAAALICLEHYYKNSAFFAENIDAIKAHPDPEEFYGALHFLHKSNILTPENREVVKNHVCAELVAKALKIMHEGKFLTQSFFNRVIKAANPVNEAIALRSELPRLRNETCHPYTIGALQGLFSKLYPNAVADISIVIAEYVSRSSGANVAKTCNAGAATARNRCGM